MKFKVILALLFLVPPSSLYTQDLKIVPKTHAQKWLANLTNNFTKLPKWFSFAWLEKVPRSMQQRVSRFFGGFKYMTIVGAIERELQCDRIDRYKFYGDKIDSLRADLRQLEPYFNLFLKTPDGEILYIKGVPVFKNRLMAKKMIRQAASWMIPPDKKDVFIGGIRPDLFLDVITNRKAALQKSIEVLTKRRDGLVADYSYVKEFAEIGESSCKRVGDIRFVGIAFRDTLTILFLIVAAILGIAFSPDIYDVVNEKLFRSQISQRPVPKDAPSEMVQAEVVRKQILNNPFPLYKNFTRRSEIGRLKKIHQNNPAHPNVTDDIILYYAELYPNIKKEFNNIMTNSNLAKALSSNISGISPIGLIASTPYIKDEKRMGYVNYLINVGIKPTKNDKELVNLLSWKLKKSVPQTKEMRVFEGQVKTMKDKSSRLQQALTPGVLNLIQQHAYPDYMQSPFDQSFAQ